MPNHLNLVFAPGVAPDLREVSVFAIRELLQLGHADHRVQINNYGVWRPTSGWDHHGNLVEYGSVDWYLQFARQKSSRANQINSTAILGAFNAEPWQRAQRHYDVMVVSEDMYSDGLNWLLGEAVPSLGCILSTARLQLVPSQWRKWILINLIQHELGHVFHVVDSQRRTDVEQNLGGHCTNVCIMRQGLTISDWVNMAQDRQRLGRPYCESCLADLRRYLS